MGRGEIFRFSSCNWPVTLAAGQPSDTWAVLRESQEKTLALPKTGMAVAIDIGESHDIHPKNKQEVGRRLALAAEGDRVWPED